MSRSIIPSSNRNLSRRSDDLFGGFRQAIDRLFDDFSDDFSNHLAPLSWQHSMMSFHPNMDVEDKDDKFVMSAEVPGMTDKDVHVELNRDFLTIKGEKKFEKEEKNKHRYLSERSYGSFERSIRLPSSVNRDKIEASVKDGVLTITLPKSAEAKKEVKKIPVHH